MYYKVYSDWAYLDKLEVGILCAVASCGGEFVGNISELYRLTRTDNIKQVGQKQRENVEFALSNLEGHLFIVHTEYSPRKHKISIIKRGKEIKLHEQLFCKIQTKHINKVAWEYVMKLFLFLEPIHFLQTTNILIADEIRVTNNKIISNSKRILKDLGCLYVKDKWDVYDYKDENGEEQTSFNYEYQSLVFDIPQKYVIIENEEEYHGVLGRFTETKNIDYE